VARHRRDELDAARWIVAPRDAIVAWLTGTVVTDVTLASRTGWCTLDDGWSSDARTLLGERLPPILPATAIVGTVRSEAAAELGLGRGVDVVLGAGDRACEVLGVGASRTTPMVSWGTTANVSVPRDGPTEALPTTGAVSKGALDGFVAEAGLSASGAALGWLSGLTGRPHDALLALASDAPPGAHGVIALPWLHGARAPWWRADAHGAFLGLTGAHGPGELARATVEAVALDVARCVELLAPGARSLSLAGAGAANALWRDVVGAATGRAWTRRRHDDAASVGARVIAAAALGDTTGADELNPVTETGHPEASLVEAYDALRERSDAAARAVLELP
jgi:sugar (pentulose or hexulose) kinase